MNISTDLPRPLLNWLLRRGRQILRLKVTFAGTDYQVSLSSDGQPKPMSVDLFQDCSQAFQRHAALVAKYRDAGWTSVTYRQGLV